MKLKDERKNISNAKESLQIEDGKKTNIYNEQLNICDAELVDLRNVWTEMRVVNDRLAEMKEIQWLVLKPKLIRTTLDELLEKIKKLPIRMRRYEVYEYTANFLSECIKV